MANVTFKGNPMTLRGEELKVGDQAPDFTALNTSLEQVSLSDFEGKRKLISVIPSIDTGVCSTQTKTFNERAAGVENVEVLTISNDLPFAQKRWTADEGLENAVTLSDHRDLSFGENYGVVMEELRLLARSVFILDEDNKVVYVEYVPEGTDHPDYDKAIEALEAM
ncbi:MULTISPECIES: thiol peroxidase [Salinicoccus]|jgi:thiol peroxidase|uniref:Thiol peroxidase n=1 Tax=Salinicoccus roseus TaxID=45670 RepID=A0A265E9D7_9STAP|nr:MULTISPECIES: thiol peroxidase [Salinicoccus]MBY8908488.1 thiol peroxidase [Salinicoccus roseus]MCC4721536.1 thiol peroxidase [Salinicoccus sp. RF5]MCG7332214.1 thiol peroxidase [Salinicoccus roseus]OZT77878.1 lipid hydroperoxide peroxidase [Salinicoccus roseus]RPE53932.1 thiol peroxidase (atypical 2-Cys peroxiredoxin) [Salinicoccus roseus]